MRAAILLLLLLATPAHAVKSIAFVGDSIHESGLSVPPSLTYKRSAHSADRTLFSLLKKAPGGNQWLNATVTNWGIPSADPGDWSSAPDATLCSTYRASYPHLEAACRDAAPIMNYIGTYDLVLVMFTGSTTPSASAWVDTLATLKTALDLTNGTILLGTSPWGPTPAASGAMPLDTFRAVRIAVEAEMSGRGIINGAHDTTATMPTSIDTLHARDQGYATQGSLWYGVLP